MDGSNRAGEREEGEEKSSRIVWRGGGSGKRGKDRKGEIESYRRRVG